ncbi:acyl carrier protein [Rhodococcus sp. H29-C3]|uniref:acyl carrier protein n=1 Tax=Rhodococcus sp. H29-C3 TaxID=3046307 RepID=UPI0024B9A11E|nr:acyl carrier protein [Rhodococcus sp. H29-C3]MDJ0362343.1 acyl carrier protein [Rhodococcus sp. H29-C3]
MTREATMEDLKTALADGSGVTDGVDLDRDIHLLTFDELGYDSLAVLDAGTRLGRDFDLEVEDAVLSNVVTPVQLVDAVNAKLREGQVS